MCSTQRCVQKCQKLNVLRNARGVKLEWNSTYFCRFDFQLKHMFQKIKSRSFICCSQSIKNNYFCSFTLLSKILNEQWTYYI